MTPTVKVRFAPSPTGYLHVGGARTALFNWLFARASGGKFVLRIEDTDRRRYQPEALDEIFASLKWLGLDWDEGPEVGGPCGPYVQSERNDLYRAKAEELLAGGHAYRCFCTEERLTALREAQEKAKLATFSGYDRHCRSLTDEEVARNLAAGLPYVVRLKVPAGRTVTFRDQIRGEISYQSDLLDDLVLLKSDGFPTYHLANVVDDHEMAITHVMRGDEWIASTPRHILLYEAFGWTPPAFAHMPVILAEGGGKLSKRKGAASVMDYQRGGILPEALFNFLALLGWNPGDDREIMTRDEMAKAFSLERITPKAAVFDEQKLEWMNGQYLARRPVASLLSDVLPLWRQAGLVGGETPDPAWLESVVALFKDRSRRIGEIAENSRYCFVDPAEYDPALVRKHFRPGAESLLASIAEAFAALPAFSLQTLEDTVRELAERQGLSAGKLIHPIRLAVSGVGQGPGLFELLEVLGRETVLRRLAAAVTWVKTHAGDLPATGENHG